MSNSANVSLVQDLYAAFARGDVGAIASACAPDVDWRLVGRKEDYPTFGDWKGPPKSNGFFGSWSSWRSSRISRRGSFTAPATRCSSSACMRYGEEDGTQDRERLVPRVHRPRRQGRGVTRIHRHRAGRGGLPRLNSRNLRGECVRDLAAWFAK
jgi:hypothetical protein